MILNAKSGIRGELKNADTGRVIRWVRWANIETGEYEAFRISPDVARARHIPLHGLIYRGHCRLVFTPAQVLDSRRPLGRVAPSTPLDEIRREVLKGGEVQVPPAQLLTLPGMPLVECDEPLCHRPAVYAVAIEQIVEPERGRDGRLYERAVTIGSAVFCWRHYRSPRQFSLRGVETEVEVSVRPQ